MFCNAMVLLSLTISAGEEKTPIAMPPAVRKQINQHIIGQWTQRVTWGDQVMEGEETIRWTKGRAGLILQGYLVADGKRTDYAALIGWDSVQKAIVGHSVNTDGETGTTRWTEISADGWKGHGEGVFQGERWQSDTKLAFGEESNQYEDVTLGKPWIAVFKRKPKPEQ